MATDAPILIVERAEKSYGERDVLRGVGLRLFAGEIYALLGRNGAGKTTLLRSICGRSPLDRGSVRLAGGDPFVEPRVRRRLGLVPQQIALYPSLTVRENFQVLGRLAGLGRGQIPSAIDRALDWSGLGDRVDDRIDRLSGGMQRRANLAAGVLHSPDVLLLDEPTVGVDPQARERLHAMLASLRSEGTATLITTHDMQEAEELADRTGILAEGRLCAEGSLEELVRAHFGRAKELTVHVSRRLDEAEAGLLRAAGLESGADGETWTGNAEHGIEDLAALAGTLAEAGLPTEEMRIREPGLREVFFRATGREYAP